MDTATIHDQRAIEAAREERDSALRVTTSARQGDLIVERVKMPVPSKADYSATPASGITLVAGSHGEHRLIAPAVNLKDNVITLPEGGLVVHTDVPSGRHRAIRLDAGVWCFKRQRQLNVEGVIEKVRD